MVLETLTLYESSRLVFISFDSFRHLNFSYIRYNYENKDMAQIISIEYPDYLANSMRLNKEDFGKEVKLSALIKLLS